VALLLRADLRLLATIHMGIIIRHRPAPEGLRLLLAREDLLLIAAPVALEGVAVKFRSLYA